MDVLSPHEVPRVFFIITIPPIPHPSIFAKTARADRRFIHAIDLWTIDIPKKSPLMAVVRYNPPPRNTACILYTTFFSSSSMLLDSAHDHNHSVVLLFFFSNSHTHTRSHSSYTCIYMHIHIDSSLHLHTHVSFASHSWISY